MAFFDIFIVYLAFGSPFAVHEFMQQRPDLSLLQRFLVSLGVLFFWLPSAIRLFRDRISGVNEKDSAVGKVVDERIKKIFTKMQREAGVGNEASAIIGFRETFDRYVGLSLEVNKPESAGDTKTAELLRISGRETGAAAEACLIRHNATRLSRHHINAREQFLESIERSQEFNTVVLALELAGIVGDAEAEKYLNRLIGHEEARGDVWNSQDQKISKEQIAA
jgi:hypothetical protein